MERDKKLSPVDSWLECIQHPDFATDFEMLQRAFNTGDLEAVAQWLASKTAGPAVVTVECSVCEMSYNVGPGWDDEMFCGACYHERYPCPSWCEWEECPND